MSNKTPKNNQAATVYDIHTQLVKIAAEEIAKLPDHFKDLTAA